MQATTAVSIVGEFMKYLRVMSMAVPSISTVKPFAGDATIKASLAKS